MNENMYLEILRKYIRERRRFSDTNVNNPRKYVSVWEEKELLGNSIVDALCIVLRTRGCYWALCSGCSMCGYINDAVRHKVSDEDIFYQFEQSLQYFQSHKVVKIYTSGSFLDNEEISFDMRKKILKHLGDITDKVLIETRPEFVSDRKLSELSVLCNLEVAIGLETYNDRVREYAINKGFTVNDYIKAANIVKKYCMLKTYILVKPPFITERYAITDAIESVMFAKRFSDEISLTPVNIQKNTLVEYLWKKNRYRAPWLWSIVDVIKGCIDNGLGNTRLVVSSKMGNSNRLPHNCMRCDTKVVNAITDFSFTQRIDVFDKLDCECVDKYRDFLSIESFLRL